MGRVVIISDDTDYLAWRERVPNAPDAFAWESAAMDGSPENNDLVEPETVDPGSDEYADVCDALLWITDPEFFEMELVPA